MFSSLRGIIAVILFALWTVAIAIPAHVFGVMQLFTRYASLTVKKRPLDRILVSIGNSWLLAEQLTLGSSRKMKFEIDEVPGASMDKSYLVISNHPGGGDIFILPRMFYHKIPVTRYFIKRSLLAFPVLGFTAWTMGMPFVRRSSSKQIARRPELREKDYQDAKKSMAPQVGRPATMAIFAEGTRFSKEKHAKQNSPYNYLLKPRAGGVGLVLATLGDQIDTIYDCTIVYPDALTPSLWDYFCGRVPRVVCRIEALTVPDKLRNLDYHNNEADRLVIREWLNERWELKDALIDRIIKGEEGY